MNTRATVLQDMTIEQLPLNLLKEHCLSVLRRRTLPSLSAPERKHPVVLVASTLILDLR